MSTYPAPATWAPMRLVRVSTATSATLLTQPVWPSASRARYAPRVASPYETLEAEWHDFLSGTHPHLQHKSPFRLIPSNPRCKLCMVEARAWALHL